MAIINMSEAELDLEWRGNEKHTQDPAFFVWMQEVTSN